MLKTMMPMGSHSAVLRKVRIHHNGVLGTPKDGGSVAGDGAPSLPARGGIYS